MWGFSKIFRRLRKRTPVMLAVYIKFVILYENKYFMLKWKIMPQ